METDKRPLTHSHAGKCDANFIMIQEFCVILWRIWLEDRVYDIYKKIQSVIKDRR